MPGTPFTRRRDASPGYRLSGTNAVFGHAPVRRSPSRVQVWRTTKVATCYARRGIENWVDVWGASEGIWPRRRTAARRRGPLLLSHLTFGEFTFTRCHRANPL